MTAVWERLALEVHRCLWAGMNVAVRRVDRERGIELCCSMTVPTRKEMLIKQVMVDDRVLTCARDLDSTLAHNLERCRKATEHAARDEGAFWWQRHELFRYAYVAPLDGSEVALQYGDAAERVRALLMDGCERC